jgi:hypothetical protein
MAKHTVLNSTDNGKIFGGLVRTADIESLYSKLREAKTTSAGNLYYLVDICAITKSGQHYCVSTQMPDDSNFALHDEMKEIVSNMPTMEFIQGTPLEVFGNVIGK